MAILVDDAIWPWRGDRWAHLCSDRDLDELHAFAHQIGVRRMAFQGDHYDVGVEQRTRALAAGAFGVGSRELLRRLRDAGLRVRAGHSAWRWTPQLERRLTPDEDVADLLAAVASLVDAQAPTHALPPALHGLGGVGYELGVRVASRPAEVAVVVSGPGLASLVTADWGDATVVHHLERADDRRRVSGLPAGHVTPGERSVLEVFIRRAVRVDV